MVQVRYGSSVVRMRNFVPYSILYCAISFNAITTILSFSLEPYEFFRSDKSLLSLVRNTCQSSADCNHDEKCVRILSNKTVRTGCFRTRSVHERCSLNVECSLRNRLSTCEHGSCKCKVFTEYDEVTNDCYSASICKHDSDCAPGKRCFASFCHDPKQFCLSKSACQPYEYCSNTRCHLAKQVGEICTKHHECKRWDVHSYCYYNSSSLNSQEPSTSICSCKSKYVEDPLSKKCVPGTPVTKDCSDHRKCPGGFNCVKGLCFREASASDRFAIENPSSDGSSTHPEKVPIFHRASNETRYYVLIAGALFMVISMIAGVAGCVRRSREIAQANQRRSHGRLIVGMRTGGRNTDSSDSRLTPRARRGRTQNMNRTRIANNDPPPAYDTIIQPPPAFEDIFGPQMKKQDIS